MSKTALVKHCLHLVIASFVVSAALSARADVEALNVEAVSMAPLSTYVRQYETPELFQDNEAALNARLKLLDHAGSGAKARIATFVFENGRATRRLATHVCLAASRGVSVELLVDSKSGDRVGQESPFNNSDDAKTQEELFQYMANCGAKVFVHNSLISYIEVMGERIPNIFLDPRLDGATYGIWSIFSPFQNILQVQNRVTAIIDRAAAVMNPQLARNDIKEDLRPFLTTVKDMAFEYLNLMSNTKDAKEGDNAPGGYDANVQVLSNLYAKFIHDPIWTSSTPEKMHAAIPAMTEAFRSDPELAKLRQVVHRFNRLNHRKLFSVESADQKDGCTILGGRNLGDHYLLDNKLSYLDGDVLICRHQGADMNSAIDQANQSFEELKTDLSDALLGLANDNVVRLVEAKDKFSYSYLRIPSELMPAGSQNGPDKSKLPVSYRTLLPALKWADNKVVTGDLQMENTSHWRVLKSSWDPSSDQVMNQLITMIDREQKEIYLETAYGEFNERLRASLENALKRGVHIRFVTNSMFISDGLSRVIRIFMANWIYRMKAQHNDLFQIAFTTSAAGHMIHFKGAGFSCQKNGEQITRSYLLGSHNFHPRSGRADKEHALTWDEPVMSGCESGFTNLNDMVNARARLYTELTKQVGTKVLTYYSDFHTELELVSGGANINEDEFKGQSILVARALRQIFYFERESSAVLKEDAKVRFLLQFMDASGLHDLLAEVL